MTRELSHIDSQGNARMVDVGDKPITLRICAARGSVRMAPETLVRISDGSVPKGDALAVARLAGIQAAKRTQDWIPLCHAIPLDAVEVELTPDPTGSCVRIEARARAHARTGVEMEALVAVSAAGLALYDMCKAIDPEMTIEAVQLISKSGGKSGDWQRPSGFEAPGEPLA
jgi:cyclic pyranopterin monophosphate synthase